MLKIDRQIQCLSVNQQHANKKRLNIFHLFGIKAAPAWPPSPSKSTLILAGAAMAVTIPIGIPKSMKFQNIQKSRSKAFLVPRRHQSFNTNVHLQLPKLAPALYATPQIQSKFHISKAHQTGHRYPWHIQQIWQHLKKIHFDYHTCSSELFQGYHFLLSNGCIFLTVLKVRPPQGSSYQIANTN